MTAACSHIFSRSPAGSCQAGTLPGTKSLIDFFRCVLCRPVRALCGIGGHASACRTTFVSTAHLRYSRPFVLVQIKAYINLIKKSLAGCLVPSWNHYIHPKRNRIYPPERDNEATTWLGVYYEAGTLAGRASIRDI